MNNRTKLGLNILAAALLLGVLGDALLRETPWGLNVLLWTGALVAAMCALSARAGGASARWRADGGWLFVPALGFAAAFAWRDSATLRLLDGLGLFVSLALLAWRARGHRIRLGGLADYVLGLGHAAFDAMFASLPLVVSDVQWATIPRRGALRHAWAAARGLVIAVPLLFVFGALFMAADAVFEGIMRQTFQLDAGVLFSHLFLMLMFAWMTGGFLRGMTLAGETAGATAAAATTSPPPSEQQQEQAVPRAAYTSITADDKGDGEAASGETGEASAHRRSPGSVVVEGGATADGRSGGASVGVVGVGGEGEKPNEEGSEGRKPEGSDEAHGPAGGAVRVGAQAAAAAVTATSSQQQPTPQGFSLGAVEVGVVLGLLNVLFACFVVVQFRYFFGGAERVMSITELTYSEYARRGFFELTWVAGLVLPLLLGAHALLRKNSLTAARVFRPLAGAQVGLLFVIMTSAVARMRLYQSEYGLTELRLYTTAFMLWLGLVFVWFAWTVLVRARRQLFACGALVAAFVTVGLLHLVNPDAYIVRANVAHARAGRPFDAAYAASLSADAVPALLSALPALDRDERCLASRALTQQGWTSAAVFDEGWRAWNFARWRARRVVSAHREALSEANCPPAARSAPVLTPMAALEPSSIPMTAETSQPNAGATTVNANAATTDAATMRMITETKGVAADAAAAAAAASSNGSRRAVRGAGGGGGRTKQHDRPRAARRTKKR